ncbi:hypothetical protein BH24ACT20_BH24ACT20_14980 [soil metagenome]|jgi:hypothetical protein
MRDYRGTVSTPGESGSATWQSESTHREALQQELLELGAWLVEHPRAARKNLKPIRDSKPLEPGVYFNQGTGIVERVYRPQRIALGSKMFRVNSDPAAPVYELRRRVMEGRD